MQPRSKSAGAILSSGFRNVTPIEENLMDRKVDHKMEIEFI